MNEKKAIKLIRVFEDGSKEYIDGEDLINFMKIESSVYAMAMIHGLKQELKQSEVKWKKMK